MDMHMRIPSEWKATVVAFSGLAGLRMNIRIGPVKWNSLLPIAEHKTS